MVSQNEPARERQATDDANAAASNTRAEPDAANAGVLDDEQRRPLPGDADEAIHETAPHRE
jgi:hypothetical protein